MASAFGMGVPSLPGEWIRAASIAAGGGLGPGEGRAREHLEELRAQAEDIGADVEGRGSFHLGSEESRLPDAHAIGLRRSRGGRPKARTLTSPSCET